MSVADILDERRAFSFEVFPPKTDAGMEKLIGEHLTVQEPPKFPLL